MPAVLCTYVGASVEIGTGTLVCGLYHSVACLKVEFKLTYVCIIHIIILFGHAIYVQITFNNKLNF